MERHDLRHEFPEHEQKITALKTSNNHFKKLFDEYHDVNNQVYKIETNAEVHSDSVLNELRMKRVHIKDEIYSILKH